MKKAIDLQLSNIIEDNKGAKHRVTSLKLNNTNVDAPIVYVALSNGLEFGTSANTELQTLPESVMFE